MQRGGPEHFSHGWAVTSQDTQSCKTHTHGQGKGLGLAAPEEAGSGARGGLLGGEGWVCLPL
jgi:hypothetical protein